MVQVPSNMDEVIDSAMAEKFNFNTWKEAVSGPTVRFHRNFRLKEFDPAWKPDALEEEPGENEFVLRNSEYRFVKNSSQVIIRLVECESVRIAHEMIFSSLKNVTHPNPPLDRPVGWDFGDVYKLGYWARDNMYVFINDLSDPELSHNELLAINSAIDNQLAAGSDACSPAGKDTPQIHQFAIALASIPVNAIATIVVSVTDPFEKSDNLQYTFSANGGRIFMKNGNYYYKAEEAGVHKLALVVANEKGLCARQTMSVKVVQ